MPGLTSGFDPGLLQLVPSGTHAPSPSGPTFRLRHAYPGFAGVLSPWHHLPLLGGVDERGDPIFHFLCEVPVQSVRKFELHKALAGNPVAQDLAGVPGGFTARNFSYPPGRPGAPANYGALVQVGACGARQPECSSPRPG